MELSKSKNKSVSLTLIGNFDLPTVLQGNMLVLHESYRTFYETLVVMVQTLPGVSLEFHVAGITTVVGGTL